MKFKSLLLLVGFIPALAMAEVAKPTPEKASTVVARPAVGVTHVYHHHIHYGPMVPPEIKMVPGQMVPGHWATPPSLIDPMPDVYIMPHIYIPWVPPKVEP
jgi:hypothetical protein